MPTTIRFTLRPTRDCSVDARKLHGLACSLLETDEDDHTKATKSFAVWPIVGSGGLIDLHLGWLSDTTLPPRVESVAALRLGNTRCNVESRTALRRSFAALSAGAGRRAATVTFHSPTYFSDNGVDVVVPDPRLIVGSYQRRWNEANPPGTPYHIGADEWSSVRRSVLLGAYELRTARMHDGHRHEPRLGFVGHAELILDRPASSSTRSIFAALVRFAAVAGTGRQTTHGFGATTSDLNPDG